MVVVSIVVLGDIGRSPRMQYHASSLSEEGFDVEVIGYEGAKPIKDLTENENIKIIALRDSPKIHINFPRLLVYIFKTIFQSLVLLYCLLFKGRRSDIILVQSPPAIPTLAIVWFYCVLARVYFIIDWHNYGFKNMALTLGDSNILVRISHWYEGFFGRRANHNFCVTKAMKDDLSTRWGVKATVFYDRPFSTFSSLTVDAKHSFFKRLSGQYPEFAGEHPETSTVFTNCLPNGKIALNVSRPALLVSSTSWTEDEDFSILLNALKVYDKLDHVEDLPQLICVITGKGPLKEYYIKLIDTYEWERVKIITPWLEAEDYPLMLGSADLGVSLHTSTSGLDLPMKVVDMFGCGLPVAAYKFYALPELVRVDENGTVFNNSEELVDQLQNWFQHFPNNTEQFNKFRKNIEDDYENFRWHENWQLNVLPILEEALIDHHTSTPHENKDE